MDYVINVQGWEPILCPNEAQAEEFGAALCLGMCAIVTVTCNGKLLHEFFPQTAGLIQTSGV